MDLSTFKRLIAEELEPMEPLQERSNNVHETDDTLVVDGQLLVDYVDGREVKE